MDVTAALESGRGTLGKGEAAVVGGDDGLSAPERSEPAATFLAGGAWCRSGWRGLLFTVDYNRTGSWVIGQS